MPVELILLALSPIFLVCIALEYYFHPTDYALKDSMQNTLLALLHQASDAIALILLMPLFYWLAQFALFNIPLSPESLLIGFLLQDFLYYWFHRASHNIHWLWCAHVVHHSSVRMNFTTAFRQSLLYPVLGMWLFWLPMILLGFDPKLVFAIVAINLAFQFFVHTKHIGKLGWLEHLFNTPTHHRIHHASNDHYLDKNYAGVLIIWDKLFGTYVEEDANITIEYGIKGPAPRNNLIAINFAQLRHMLKSVRHAHGLKAKIQAMFGYPSTLDSTSTETSSIEFTLTSPHSREETND
ncbi:sterol desaturase family protein [Pseudoalteromonas xiamenensis]